MLAGEWMSLSARKRPPKSAPGGLSAPGHSQSWLSGGVTSLNAVTALYVRCLPPSTASLLVIRGELG